MSTRLDPALAKIQQSGWREELLALMWAEYSLFGKSVQAPAVTKSNVL